MDFKAEIKIEIAELTALADQVQLTVIDAAAVEIGFNVLKMAMIYLENQVYTRPNAQVTADKMPYVPEPTGALWNSGYLRNFTKKLPSGYPREEDAMTAAKAKNPEVQFGKVPRGPTRLGHVQVIFTVEYGIFIEMGTAFGMVARPYLAPAMDEVGAKADQFIKAKLLAAGFTR